MWANRQQVQIELQVSVGYSGCGVRRQVWVRDKEKVHGSSVRRWKLKLWDEILTGIYIEWKEKRTKGRTPKTANLQDNKRRRGFQRCLKTSKKETRPQGCGKGPRHQGKRASTLVERVLCWVTWCPQATAEASRCSSDMCKNASPASTQGKKGVGNLCTLLFRYPLLYINIQVWNPRLIYCSVSQRIIQRL